MSIKSTKFIIRTTPELREEVEKISDKKEWSISKTCEKLIKLALEKKLL